MASLDDNARALLQSYKSALGPSEEASRLAWAELSRRAQMKPVETTAVQRMPGRSWMFGFAGAAAAALVVFIIGRAHPRSEASTVPPALSQANHVSVPDDRSGTAEARRPRAAAPVPALEPEPVAEAPEPPAMAPNAAVVFGPVQPPRETPVSPTKRVRSEHKGSPRHRAPKLQPSVSDEPAQPENVADLQEQIRLLAACRRASRDGDHDRAISLADGYRQRFGEGAFAEEIAMLRLNALCRIGAGQRWENARAEFGQRYPGSPLRAHLLEECES